MKTLFNTGLLRTLNLNINLKFLKKKYFSQTTRKVFNNISIDKTFIIGYLHLKNTNDEISNSFLEYYKSLTKLELDKFSINKFPKIYMMSTITSIPDYVKENKFFNFLDSVYILDIKTVVLVSPSYTEYKIYQRDSYKISNFIIIIEVPLNKFSIFIQLKYNKLSTNNKIMFFSYKTLYFFDCPWYNVIEDMKKFNIFIYGGDSTKRHILSPYQYKLALVCYNLKISINFISKVYNSNSSLLKNKRSYSTNNTYSINSYNKNYNFLQFSNSVRTRKVFFSTSNVSLISKEQVFFKDSPLYLAILNILNDNKINNFEKQILIENLLYEGWIELIENSFKNKAVTNSSFKFIHKVFYSFNNTLEVAISQLSNDKKEILDILNGLLLKQISLISLNIVMPILSMVNKENYTTLMIKIGKRIYHVWLVKNFKESNYKLFNEYKKSLNRDDIELEKIYLSIGHLIIKCLLDSCSFFELKSEKISSKETILWIKPTKEAINLWEKQFYMIGLHIPMINPPRDWTLNNNGGYYYNKERMTEELIHLSVENIGKTSIRSNNILKGINKMQNVPFRINKEMLNLILEKGEKYGFILSGPHPNTDKIKLSKKEYLEIEIHNSRYYLEQNILGLAQLFSHVDSFYFPLYLDWRGRIYTLPYYLSYQGTELAKCLIEFKLGGEMRPNPDLKIEEFINNKINPRGFGFAFLKIYGANCYGLDKLSFKKRLEWIEKNHENIIKMDDEILKKADSPLLFLAFSIEYKKCCEVYKNKKSVFFTHLPIQFDATCNGIQHLSSLITDINLAKYVNLKSSKYDEDPNDIYSISIKYIEDNINEYVKEYPFFERLKLIKLNRKMIKKSIMTIPYSVTKIGVRMQLEEFFDKEYKKGTYYFKPINGDIWISAKELNILAEIVHKVLFKTHPKLQKLVDYFHKLIELLNYLNLPLI